MSTYLKFRIGKDKRKLVPINGFELKDADSNNPQWLQGRQNEDGGRQVFVDLEDENGSPINLTGASAVFKGVLPGGQYKIWDHKSSTIIDAQAGRFRYTFPKRAMAIAGSYKQAFFEIFREGTKLATLEFNFEVLADLVEENIIPSDYITPFEDLYGKLKKYLVKFNGDFDTAMTQWKKDVAGLITELNADVSGINLTISEIKTQLSALEDKIKADGLLTLADFNVLKDELLNRMDAVEHQDILNFRNKLKYKTISATIYSDSESISGDQLNHIKATGADLALITMVTVDNANDSSPTDISVTTFNDVIKRAKNIGLNITMLKPHIGIAGQHDSFSRKDYLPDDPDGFFENWKDLMLHYADLAVTNSIPVLCIGCEMFNQTDVKYLTKWQDIYNTIKAKYPDLLITYAMSQYEFFEPENQGQIASVIDYIGMNIYPSYISSEYKSGLKVRELKGAWWNDWNGNQFMETLDEYFDEYQKPILVTETGLMPYKDGLAHLISSYINSNEKENYDAQAIGYKAALEAIAKDSHVIGVSIWHASKPFSFISKDVNTVTPSEKVLTQYFKGGKI
ncbi:BppU family phage baseplate upper protein [Pediococcus pentosaceus]|uniref:BppU family phage baseplate upper protein n=1 Tax=Pediococcus pentosaceus TaxID=1255 RepID=UPI0018FEEC32|nr:BppU family phage baseplate upper protein [Pediococcus pentosaceus]MBF7131087.1 BppU family phage baseplate upper protein [Pediococcus pentosaceus]